MGKTVLVGVLRSRSDLPILLKEKWYRIPLAHLPKRPFTHIAFYQPECFGAAGKRIEYFGRVAKRTVLRRAELLPAEAAHERAAEPYLKCSFRTIEKLERPIRNIIPRRVSFGYTDLRTLRAAGDILDLYHVPPTEQLIEAELRRLEIPFVSQYRLSAPSRSLEGREGRGVRQYRLDLAIFCRRGNVAIECDNRKAHSGKAQQEKDREKDAALEKLGWRVVRLTESDIVDDLPSCICRIKKAIRSKGEVTP